MPASWRRPPSGSATSNGCARMASDCPPSRSSSHWTRSGRWTRFWQGGSGEGSRRQGFREPEWPEAFAIIGNPPFLGGKRLRTELGDAYVDALFRLYEGRVPAFGRPGVLLVREGAGADRGGEGEAGGLLATQAIRGGANRKVLERIKETGDVFWAQSDRNWILDGATVHVSMVGFDDGTQTSARLMDERSP